MKFSLGKIKTALGKDSATKEAKNEKFLEDIKASVPEKPFALSEKNIMLAGMKELAGYFYFRVVIVGRLKLKTFTGAKLTINCKDLEMTLSSDMNELESEFGQLPNSYVTVVDFEIEKAQIKKLNASDIDTLRFVSKKHDVIFTTTKA